MMEGSERDTTQEWLLPESARPPLVSELVERIEEALAVARSSEAAAVSIGAAALDAADQARRAAELAERASVAMAAERVPEAATAPAGEVAPGGAGAEGCAEAGPGNGTTAAGGPALGGLDEFTARADRLAARLRALEAPAGAAPPASGDAALRRPAA